MSPDLPYYSYSRWLREQLGGRAYKVGLDARLTCPNIDGTVAKGGCTFCTNPSFSFQPMDAASRGRDLREQLRQGIEFYREKRGAERFIAYFQTFTNTYAPPDVLRELYGQVLEEDGVVGISISTRPDAVEDDVVDVLEEVSRQTFLIVEMGLQTANDATLRAINRGHDLDQFRDAMTRLTARGLRVKVHLLFGLPGDGPEDALASVREVNASGAEGVKLHHLQVLHRTQMGRDYLRNPFPVFTFEEYATLLASVVSHLDPAIYVDRLFATCRPDLVIAPDWGMAPNQTRERLLSTLRERGVTQGCAFEADSGRLSLAQPAIE